MFQHELAPAALLLLAKACSAWDFVVYPDSGCNTNPPSDHESGSGARDCTAVPANYRSFGMTSFGNYRLYFYSSQDNCDNDEWEQLYDNDNQDTCIPPQFTWDYYVVSSKIGRKYVATIWYKTVQYIPSINGTYILLLHRTEVTRL